MAKQYCYQCKNYRPLVYKISTGQLNVSGRSAWYNVWSKFKCNLMCRPVQPKPCSNFEEKTLN